MKLLTTLLPRYLRKQSKRAALTALGIALAVALLTAVGIVGASLRQTLIDQAIELTGEYHGAFTSLTGEQVAQLRADPRFDAVGVAAGLGAHHMDSNFITIEAFDATAREIYDLNLVRGRYPESAHEIVLEAWMLDYLDLPAEPGQRLHLTFSHSYRDPDGELHFYAGEGDFVLVGVLESITAAKVTGASLGLVSFETVEALLPPEYLRYHAFVHLAGDRGARETLLQVQAELGLGEKQISLNDQLLSALGEGQSVNWPVLLLGAVVVVATISTIYNAFHISVLERLQQFGMLRALGATAGQLRVLVLGEALILAAVALPAGLLAGVGGAALLVDGLSLLRELMGRLVIPPAAILAAGGLGLGATLASALLPAIVAGRIPPLEAIAHHRRVLKGRPGKRAGLIQSWLGVTGRMAYQNLWRNARRSLVTIFSLGIGVVLFIVFSAYAAGADATAIVDGMLIGDYALSMQTPERGQGYAPAIAGALEAIAGVEQVYGLQSDFGNRMLLEGDETAERLLTLADTEREGDRAIVSTTLLGYGDDELALTAPYLLAGEIDPGAMAESPALLLVDPHGESGLQVGDPLTVRHYYRGEEGVTYRERTFTVAGILRDAPLMPSFRAGGPTTILHPAQFAAFVESDVYKRFDVILGPKADVAAVEGQLEALAESAGRGDLISYTEEVAELEEQKRQMMWLVYGLVAVVTVIGTVNIVNTITTNLILRTREFGMLRAVGVTRRQLRRMTQLEGLFYGLFSAAWGGTVGGILAYLLFLATRSEMTYLAWSLPWPAMVLATGGCVLVGVAATLLPVRRIARLEVVEALRTVV